jgi:hypothetical protein
MVWQKILIIPLFGLKNDYFRVGFLKLLAINNIEHPTFKMDTYQAGIQSPEFPKFLLFPYQILNPAIKKGCPV